MGWHDDPEARLVEQFPIAPLTGAEIPVQVAERHNAAVKMPLVQVEVRALGQVAVVIILTY